MTIIKLRRPFLLPAIFLPYGPFAWSAKLAYPSYTQPSRYDSSYDFTEPFLNETETDIGNVYVDNEEYVELTSTALVLATEKSWYFDFAAQILYIHISHDRRMTSSDFDSLEIRGYSSDYVFYDSNDIEFLPYLQSSTTITKSADRLVYNKMGLVKNRAVLDNTDGEFDDIDADPTPGADANVLYISEADRKSGSRILTPIYTGYVSADGLSLERARLQIQDKRAQYNEDIPSTVINSTDYPNASDSLGELIPEGYGDITGAPAICVNDSITSGNVEYKYASDGTSITTVYVKDDNGVWQSKTPVSTDPTNGEYVLSATDARTTSGVRESKVDCRLRAYDNPADIMQDMITRYLGIQYRPDTFNTTQWEAEKAYLDDIYFYMGESKPFFEQIERMQNASNYGFRFDIDADGKFTFKVDDINRAISKEYPYICNISDVTPSERDFTQYATSVTVLWGEDISDGYPTANSVIDDTYETATFDKYRYSQQRQYESFLKNSTDASTKAGLIALDYSEARSEISFTVDIIDSVELYDIIKVDTSVYSKGVKVREYLGEKILKISGIRWDFQNESTTISGYDITDIRG